MGYLVLSLGAELAPEPGVGGFPPGGRSVSGMRHATRAPESTVSKATNPIAAAMPTP